MIKALISKNSKNKSYNEVLSALILKPHHPHSFQFNEMILENMVFNVMYEPNILCLGTSFTKVLLRSGMR